MWEYHPLLHLLIGTDQRPIKMWRGWLFINDKLDSFIRILFTALLGKSIRPKIKTYCESFAIIRGLYFERNPFLQRADICGNNLTWQIRIEAINMRYHHFT